MGKSNSLLCIIGFMLYSGSALSICNPRDFAMRDIDLKKNTSYTNIIYLENISKEKFEEMKNNGQLGVAIPDIPVPLSLSFEDFRKIITTESSSRNLKFTQSQSDTFFKSRMSEVSGRMYKDCLQNEGVYSDIEVPENAIDSEEFVATLTWRGPNGVSKGKLDSVGSNKFIVLGGEIIDAENYNKIEELKSGQRLKIPIKRNLDKPFSLSGSVEAYSAEINLPPKPAASTVRYETARGEDIPAYGDGLNDQHPQSCLNAKDNEEFLPSTARTVDTLKMIPTSGRASSQIIGQTTPNQICMQVNAVVDNPKRVARIISHIEVLKIIKPEKK